jgi:hypothetical protein
MARIDLPSWGGEDLLHALLLLIPESDRLCGWGGHGVSFVKLPV